MKFELGVHSARLFLLWLILSLGNVAVAQSPVPTAQQLEQLRNLPPEQKQQLIELLQSGSVPSNQPQAPSSDSNTSRELAPLDESDAPEIEGPLELAAGSTVVIDLVPEVALEDIENVALRETAGKRAYQVDASGNLNIPGIESVYVTGLTAEQVEIRLAAEPLLANFSVFASILPLQEKGAQAVSPFGYDLFESTAADSSNGGLPVPLGYVLGPGDTINVQLYGNQNQVYTLQVGRDGQVSLPAAGPVTVSGMTFSSVREELVRRIEDTNIGVNVSVTMGELRSMQVFVLGDVLRPGAYSVSSLSTVTTALRRSGGPSPTGSLRNIQIKRANRVVGRLDLYNFLLRGNTAGDVRLLPGDAVFVPPVGPQVTVLGEVRRPAVYELRGDASLQDILSVAGGTLPSAYRKLARIERFSTKDGRRVLTVDLDASSLEPISAGDVVSVLPALDRLRDSVVVVGHVERTGPTQWRPGMRASDLFPSRQLLKAGADFDYVLVFRRADSNGPMDVFSFSLNEALRSPGSAADPQLMPADTVRALTLRSDRSRLLRPTIEQLRKQASVDARGQVITVSGVVRAPGEYPLETGMRISDAIRAGGGLRESAYLQDAELTRYAYSPSGGRRETAHMTVDIEAIMNGSQTDDIELQPYDYLTVKEIPEWSKQRTMRIQGEVRFPGEYTVARGELLSSVIERAGGLTALAFSEGSVFLREELREREAEQLRRLASRVRREVSALPEDSPDARSNAENLLTQLEATQAQGRLVIVLDQLLALPGNEQHDILVEDGDRLIIPPRQQDVTVVGEVQYTTSHIYSPELSRSDYILKSGGLTANADKKRIYVVRANGNVLADAGSRWYARNGAQTEIRPGDTIVIPIDANKISKLSLWTSVTQILYNIGIAAAAVSAL
ncbi:MAG: SLBB domain-containing protein [Gammaproteobacteria bacterium]